MSGPNMRHSTYTELMVSRLFWFVFLPAAILVFLLAGGDIALKVTLGIKDPGYWEVARLWWIMSMVPFAVTLISAADGDGWGRTLPEWKHLQSPDHQYTLHRLSNEEKKDLKVTESNEVYVHWSGWFVPTGIFVNSMEEFVEFKVNKKYDTKVIKV